MSRLNTPPMQVKDGTGLVRAPGVLDILSVAGLRTELTAAAAASDGGCVVLDLGGLEFLDSAGIGVMVGAHRRALERGAVFVVACVPELARRRLGTCGLEKVFTFADSVEDALELCRSAR